jgi:hypothetical protein
MMPRELHIVSKIMVVAFVLFVLMWPRNLMIFLTSEGCDETALEKGIASLMYSEE